MSAFSFLQISNPANFSLSSLSNFKDTPVCLSSSDSFTSSFDLAEQPLFSSSTLDPACDGHFSTQPVLLTLHSIFFSKYLVRYHCERFIRCFKCFSTRVTTCV